MAHYLQVPRLCGRIVLALLVYCFGYTAALAKSIDTSPKMATLLSDSDRFIARDGWNSTALCRASDGTVVHRFVAPTWINTVAVTSDEEFLLLACNDGRLSLWKIDTGERVWELSSSKSGLDYAYDANFAKDGESCVVCDYRDKAQVLHSRTSQPLGVVRFPPMQTNIMSAALSPDGTNGVLIELGGRLHEFAVTTGQVVDTGLTGAWPVRYSVDGKYIAFRSSNSGTSEQLTVVAMDGKFVRQDIGQFSHIGHIKATGDGTFLVSGMDDKATSIIGVQVWPATKQWKELWRLPVGAGVNEKTDFLPESMIGVSTDYRLVTTLTDLRNGNVLRTFDNNANRQPPLVARIYMEVIGSIGLISLVCGAIVTIGLLVFILRRRQMS